MQLYQFNFRQKYFVASLLLMVFIVGCVSVKKEQSNQSFMVSTGNDISSSNQHWRKGDIIYVANGYADHMGLIDKSVYAVDGSPDVIDSDGNGFLRRHDDIDKWVDQGGWAVIEGYYVDIQSSDSSSRKITNNFTIGEIYNAQTQVTYVSNLYVRNTPTNAYGSQLVRHAYKYLYDIDLDADGGWWSWPKDIRKNTKVKAIPKASFAHL